MNRFANIFWHYYGGACLGFRQRLWPEEKHYSGAAQILAILIYVAQLGVLLFVALPAIARLGLALILFSPQWLYAVSPLPHPVFEYRAYGMAAGVALVLGWALTAHPLPALMLCCVWAWRSYVRRQILVEPLRFWRTAQEEDHGS